MTQSVMADAADVSVDTIGRAEKGEPISLENAMGIASALNVAVADLCTDQPSKAAPEINKAKSGAGVSEAGTGSMANDVAAWLVRDGGSEMSFGLVVQNGSKQVAYDMIASLVSLQGAFRETAVGDARGFQRFLGIVPPGELRTRIEYGGDGMFLRFGIELAFQDPQGRFWLRKGNGFLNEVFQSPLELYGIDPPVSWDN